MRASRAKQHTEPERSAERGAVQRGAVIRPIIGWAYDGAVMTPEQAKRKFGNKLWGYNRPAGLVPIFDTIGQTAADA